MIEEICNRLNISVGSFVEFGAWDGKHLSNTFSLLKKGWRGVYIEGDKEKYRDLLETSMEFTEQITPICAWVHYEGEYTLDNLLAKTPVPIEFELLSIDVDSYDWHIWNSLQNYKPKIVIIEGKSTVLPGIWQVHEDGVTQGNSFSALLGLGNIRGYELVCHTGNLIFVRKEFLAQLNLDPIHICFPENLFNYKKHFEELRYQNRLSSRIDSIIPAKIKDIIRKIANT